MKPRTLILATGVLLTAFVESHAQPTFTQVTNEPIVTDSGMFILGAWADFHNDGFLDLFLSNWNGRTNVFYRNNGNGTFTKITQGPPLLDPDYHTAAAAADYDNDGYPDLMVGSGAASTLSHIFLYHNNGDGTFNPVSGGILTNQLGEWGNASWMDYDNDGFVDLFVTNFGDQNGDGGTNALFHNHGDGTFSRVITGAIVQDVGAGFANLWTDYDNDGFPDMVLINGKTSLVNGHNFVYHNNGDGSFTRIRTNAIALDYWPNGTHSGAWGDYDNDGLPDLFVGDNGGVRNHLYHNNGHGSFTNVTSGTVLVPPSVNGVADCAWGDYDNDGYLDLFVGSWNGPNGLYHNNGDGTFTRVFYEPFLNATNAVMNSVAWVDYDNDGSLDLFLARFTLNNGVEGPDSSLLYHNSGNTNGWLEVKLVGAVSNRSGIGAKVRVHATISGKAFWQLREITSGGGWDLHPLVAHFGLGNATNVETLRIEWPSGIVQELHDVAPRQALTVIEPPRLLFSTTNGVPQFSIKGGRNLQYEIESSADLLNWTSTGVLTITNFDGTAQIMDTNGAAAYRRFYRALSR